MAIQGLRDTSNFVTDQRPKNWREGIMLLKPNGMTPLTALTSLMKSRKVDDPEFNWWEKEMQTRRVALGANIAADTAGTNSTFTVTSGAKGFKAGDLLKSEKTGEIVRVYSDPTSDTSLVVTRGFAGTTSTAITYNGAGVNPNFICIGSAFEEGSLAPTGVAFDPTKITNYTQIFRSTLEATRTAAKTRLRTGDAIKEAKRECLENIMNDVERALWNGVKSEGTLNGKPVRTMDGVLSRITTNVVTNTDGSFSMSELEGWLETAFNYGSSEKMGFCGNRVLTAIQQVIRKNSQMTITPGIKEYGMAVVRLTTPYGELVLKSHPLFNQQSGGTTGGSAYYGLNSSLVILDMDNLKYVTFQDDDIKYQADLQSNGLDGEKSGYLGELSLEVGLEKSHMVIHRLDSGVADA